MLSVKIFPHSEWQNVVSDNISTQCVTKCCHSCKSDSLLDWKLWVRTDSLDRRGFTFTDGNRQNVWNLSLDTRTQIHKVAKLNKIGQANLAALVFCLWLGQAMIRYSNVHCIWNVSYWECHVLCSAFSSYFC